jgi:hypothetical protein
MKVLIACEFSGRVRDAFIAKGHNAWSCDILPSESKGPHIQGDVLKELCASWDLLIAHPPCTYLSYAATRVWNTPGRDIKRQKALDFFLKLYNAPIPKIAVENPVGWQNSVWRKPDQIIHPYYFGDNVQKRTCLWLKNLPKLVPTNLLPKPEPLYICQGPKSKGKKINWCEGIKGEGPRAYARSRTFKGIAEAMAQQWG